MTLSSASSAPASPVPPKAPTLRPQETNGNLDKDLNTDLFELPAAGAAVPATPPPSPRPKVTDHSAPN